MNLKMNFDFNWYFSLGDLKDAYKKEYDDSNWRLLNLPHDWSIEGEFSLKNPSGKSGAYLPAGIGWYRKHFKIKREWIDKRIYIFFDGIYMNSEVWVNGCSIGKRPYGYISFDYDITDYIGKGENVIAVRVDNSKSPSGRWYTGSGIYRHTWLNVRNMINISERDLFIRTNECSSRNAEVWIDFSAVNNGLFEKCINVEIEIKYNGEREAFGEIKDFIIDGRSSAAEQMRFNIKQPKLWYPDTPELYEVEIVIKDNEEILDSIKVMTGFRYFQFDSDNGFSLNGKQIKLKGICMHHDAGPLGAAVPDIILESRLKQLKEMGCNAIRTSHNPFAPEFYDMCSRMGIMVVDEIFDGWHEKARYDYGAMYFEKWWRRDTADFVCRDRNHPCVIMWSIGNETGDTDLFGISDFIHSLDPTRPTTGGQILYGVDVAGFNGPSEVPGYLEEMKLEHPKWKMMLTEVPHTYQTRGFYRTLTWWRDYKRARYNIPDLTNDEIFDDYSSEYSHIIRYNSSYDNQTVRINNRDSWKRTRDTEYISGQFQWTGFDYLGESFGWPFKSGNNGIIDLCGFPKDIYYFYKSQWTYEPVLHIFPHWTHDGKEGLPIPVCCYTNCDIVELFLNGQSAGKKKADDNMMLRWDIPYKEGLLTAVGVKDEKIIVRVIKTAKEPSDIKMEADLTSINNERNDMAQVTLTITDENGTMIPYADNRIYFHTEGPASLKAAGNGDPADLETYTKNNRKAFFGMCKAFLSPIEQDGIPVLWAAAVLGRTYFEVGTVVTICLRYFSFGIFKMECEPEIYYTLDGKTPDIESSSYNGPFSINESKTINALIIINDEHIIISQSFRKGRRTENDIIDNIPISRSIVGKWMSENGKVYYFRENGRVEIKESEENDGKVFSWWYDDSSDVSGNDTNDEILGEINYTFQSLVMHLVNKNTLSIADRGTYEILKKE